MEFAGSTTHRKNAPPLADLSNRYELSLVALSTQATVTLAGAAVAVSPLAATGGGAGNATLAEALGADAPIALTEHTR
jgi:hypothetical protein